MIANYNEDAKLRARAGIPPLPLNASQVAELLDLLVKQPNDPFLLSLLEHRIEPGVAEPARLKALWLEKLLMGAVNCVGITPRHAITLLSRMSGGYCVEVLVRVLQAGRHQEEVAAALKQLTNVYDAFDTIRDMAKTSIHAQEILTSWARADWFTTRPRLADEIVLTIYKVDGEINTDDLSPGNQAHSRTDIPLHATWFGKSRFPGGIEEIAAMRGKGDEVAFAGDVVGTGSSRKSAVNSLLWHIGEDIPGVPNKRRGGFMLGTTIAPIFYSSARDAGILPLEADLAGLKTGDAVIFSPHLWQLRTTAGQAIAISPPPATLLDEYRAGGRLNLIIGKALTRSACQATGLAFPEVFAEEHAPTAVPDQGYTLAQKMIGKACGVTGVLPGTMCLPKISTVGSQDTTGPMTMQEVEELACTRFKTDLFLQTFCHTAAYPKTDDLTRWDRLSNSAEQRGGLVLKPGDGVIHSWINKMLLPDQVGTGGDSHTRFPLGISFPAGSGLIAFAAALGFMPLEMPQSVLVTFHGRRKPGITVRDMVNAIPYFARHQGLLSIGAVDKKNIFSGMILEIEGVDDLSVDEAFELCDASAERSASACTIRLPLAKVIAQVEANIEVLEQLLADGYRAAEALARRIDQLKNWLAEPELLVRDDHAEFVARLDIDLATITQPLLACPNDPDDVRLLEECAGQAIDEVFIGSCMTHLDHLRHAVMLVSGESYARSRLWVAPTTRLDRDTLKREGGFASLAQVGARLEVPGCSLCMGNQARVTPGAVVFSTSTRNFDNRLGDGAKVYLGSTEIAAMTALTGKIPDVEQYFAFLARKIDPC